MSIWIFIWLVVSAILIGATVWSASILFKQKKAWAAYAKKKGFTFDKGTFMGPAQMQGAIGKYELAFFTAERQDADVRKRRYVTVLEIQLPGIVDGAAAGTSEMVPFLKTLTRLTPREIKSDKWNPAFRFFSHNDKAMDAYLTEERIEALSQILGTKVAQSADVLIMFDGNEGLIRVETSDPLEHPAKIDRLVKHLLKNAQTLIPDDTEKKKLDSWASGEQSSRKDEAQSLPEKNDQSQLSEETSGDPENTQST